MATDVARLSFDPGRHYTGVVPQQGRVSLEAEQNEQRVIDASERRKELLDIVGPAGTPDDGYAVSLVGGMLTVGTGTMYVGGLRVELDAPVGYENQPDWLDRPRSDVIEVVEQHVVLLLTERDVTAVEDPMLYEPALGGPDGAARTRIVQHIELLPTKQRTCAGALAEDEQVWLAEGLTFDPATMKLNSNGRLLVSWEGPPEPPDPCEPSFTGGYLGAENQLIRVQITSVDFAAGTFDIVWGYDDASMLYRVTPDASTNPILTLERSPVDDYHRPRAGQAVQVLRSTAELPSTDAVVEGYIAALGGQVGVLTAPYDPDTKTVQFPAPLPAAYLDPAQTPQLYLRVWEQLLTGNQLGAPISLTGTGVQVTISVDGGGIPHVDDYWCIAVRPSTPTTVYPDRLLRTPQPPDGPRQWVCPLAVVLWRDGQLVILQDCRHHFPPLIDAQGAGCCTIEVHPADASSGQLAALIDRAAAGRVLTDHSGRITVCFAPGRYELPSPLVLRSGQSSIALQACSDGVVIAAQAGQEAQFGQGLIVLAGADNVTITGFEFELPQVPAAEAKISGVSGAVFEREVIRAVNAMVASRYVSIGIRPVNCAGLEVTDCLFRFSVGGNAAAAEASSAMPRNVFGIAIFAAGGAWGLRLRRNQFRHAPEIPFDDQGVRRVLIGYLLTPTAAPRVPDPKAARSLGAAHLPALLDDAEITDNAFDGITVPVLAVATLGTVRVRDNLVTRCYGGFWLLDATSTANTDLVGSYEIADAAVEQLQLARTALGGGVLDPTLVHIVVLSETYPLPVLAGFEVQGVATFELDQLAAVRTAAGAAQRAWMTNAIALLTAEQAAGGTPPQPKPAEATFNPVQTAPDQTLAAALNRTMLIAWQGINELQRIAITEPTLDTALWVERNDIDCRTLEGAASGPGLFVYVVRESGDVATAIVGDNRVITPETVMTAAVIGLRGATITGNIIGATVQHGYALAVLLIPAVAITGNVVAGRAQLPVNRPFPAPLDTWLPLNTISG